MAAPNSSRTIYGPATLWTGVTSVSNGRPATGTQLGRIQGFRFVPVGDPVRVECEGLGEASDLLEGSNFHLLVFALRGWDTDAIARLFDGNNVAGSTSGHEQFDVPGTASPGQSALTRALQLVIAPDDPVNVPGLIAYRAVPYIPDGSAGIPWNRAEEMLVPVTCQCFRDSSDRTVRIGRMVDLPIP